MANLTENRPSPAPSFRKPPVRVNLSLLKDCVEMLGQALASHHHQWTPQQRRLWENAHVEIRRHLSANPNDPPVPTHRLANKGVNVKDRVGAPTPMGRTARVPLQRLIIG